MGNGFLPGAVDAHVHLSKPWVDDFTTGSQAALAGGITSIGHMCFPQRVETLQQATFRTELEIQSDSIADVFLHPVVLDPNSFSLDELKQLSEAGHSSIKLFMVNDAFNVSMLKVEDLIRAAGKAGMMTMIHAEDKKVLDQAIANLASAGKTSLKHYLASRPVESEVLATKKAVQLCKTTNASIYLVHLSSADSLGICRAARKAGFPLFVETRPMYLHLTESVFDRADYSLFIGMPPVRTENDVIAMWQGIVDGSIQTIASDHAPWTKKQKLDDQQTLENPRGGVNNLQVMLPMLMSEGVRTKKISMEKFVEVTSTNPAKLFGLYPKKGVIAVGSDADIAIWDLDLQRTIDGSKGYSRAGFSIYDETQVTGWPTTTIRRGKIVFDDNQVIGRPGSGQVLRQSLRRRNAVERIAN